MSVVWSGLSIRKREVSGVSQPTKDRRIFAFLRRPSQDRNNVCRDSELANTYCADLFDAARSIIMFLDCAAGAGFRPEVLGEHVALNERVLQYMR